MRKIRVTVGTVGFYDAKHAHKRKTVADGPFECEDTQAERFVSAGVAEYVGVAIEADEVDEQEVTGHLAKEPARRNDDPAAPEPRRRSRR